MSACKLSCVRRKKRQSADFNKVDGCQEVLECCHSQRPTIPVSCQPLPTTCLRDSTVGSCSPRVKCPNQIQSCSKNCSKSSRLPVCLGQSTACSSSPRVKGLCRIQSCAENLPKQSNTLKDMAMMVWSAAKGLWKIKNDPFYWQLLKSVTMFTLGLKLFNDLYRHMRNSCNYNK